MTELVKEESSEKIEEPAGTFLTGVEIDGDQWRAEVVEDLTNWLNDLKNKKTEFGEPLVEFPDDWENKPEMTQKQQIDLIQKGLAAKLTGKEAKEAQTELQNIRHQADQIRALDKQLAQFGSDSDDDLFENKEEEDDLEKEVTIPEIDLSGPNPFEITGDLASRLKEIDEKLGYSTDGETTAKSLQEINEELLKIYSKDAPPNPNPAPQPIVEPVAEAPKEEVLPSEPVPSSKNSPKKSAPNSHRRGGIPEQKVMPPLQQAEAPKRLGGTKKGPPRRF